MTEVKIETEFIKLDQFLKYENIVPTGGEAKNAIMDGMIKVNGQVELARGKKLRPGDKVEAFGETYIII
ncbi:MAG: RNA-binding S4 domain-containing protein [Bacillota bacterium]